MIHTNKKAKRKRGKVTDSMVKRAAELAENNLSVLTAADYNEERLWMRRQMRKGKHAYKAYID